VDWAEGDFTGLDFPAHPEALRAAGPEFLTAAFHSYGSLSPDNRVVAIVHCERFQGGSTGQKLLLTLRYAYDEPGLAHDLFVKFSRDFDDPIFDLRKQELEAEVRLASISRHPNFPIAVARAYFADHNRATGTGILITERIAFGENGIALPIPKCKDHLLRDPLPYYRALLTALARLAAAHKSGRIAAEVDTAFPFDPERAAAEDPIPYSAAELSAQVAAFAALAAEAPQLFPAHIRDPEFIARFETEALRFREAEAAIKRFLHAQPDYVALCHWNAHIDNGWYWQGARGELQCGLMDWGRVRQLNLGYALWGCLSGATISMWDAHLDDLLTLFIGEYHAHGGPLLDLAELKLHLNLYTAMIGLSGLLLALDRVLHRVPQAASANGPHDPMFDVHDQARNFLHIFNLFLHRWQVEDFGAMLDKVRERL
jgi:hypothetical protein